MNEGEDMAGTPCRECGKEYPDAARVCPHCHTPKNPDIPRYPAFSGSWVIKVIGILFLALVAVQLVSIFAGQD